VRHKLGSISKVRHKDLSEVLPMVPYIPEQLPLTCLSWDKLVGLIGRANRELASYDGLLQGLINPLVLLSPLTTQEAVLSSKIEGTQATLEDVLEFDAKSYVEDQKKQDDIQEVLNYREAMQVAVEELTQRPLTLNLIRRAHEVLMDHVRGHNKRRGTFRTTQNWIGPAGCPLEKASFVPPSPIELPQYLNSLEKYFHFKDVDAVAQVSIIHAQFELIHPFMDGNGRLGRMLIPLFLFQHGVISSPCFYLSAYLESHRDEYYKRLREISRTQDWLGWMEFFLQAVIEQAAASKAVVKNIMALYAEMKAQIPRLTRSSHATEALDLLFSKPMFTANDFSVRAGIPRGTAARLLKSLELGKIIERASVGQGREAGLYVFTKLLKVVS
jgi:Fic family protein